jgi:hypothetical protein
MTKKPILVDLYCCAGGATRGYQRAGFYVVGVDSEPQPNYCGDEFYKADALDFIERYGHMASAVAGSPPCQFDCTITLGTNKRRRELHTDMMTATRAALLATGKPYVIENPPGGASKKMRVDLTLCGEMFGLAVIRHRNFELGRWSMDRPPHPKHRGRVAGMRHGEWFEGPYFAVYGQGGGKGTVAQWQAAMGIDWTDVRRELAEAIPPAYTEYIGNQLIKEVLA